MVVRHLDAVRDGNLAPELRHAAAEMSERSVPARSLEMACSLLVSDLGKGVATRTEDDLISSEEDVATDALEAVQVLSVYADRRTAVGGTETGILMSLVEAAAHTIRWRRDRLVARTIHSVVDVLSRQPRTLTAECERSLLLGLRRLLRDTAIHRRPRSTRSNERGGAWDVAERLVVRRAAARLAYWMFGRCRERDGEVPDEVESWKTACESDEEFAEVRRQWIGTNQPENATTIATEDA